MSIKIVRIWQTILILVLIINVVPPVNFTGEATAGVYSDEIYIDHVSPDAAKPGEMVYIYLKPAAAGKSGTIKLYLKNWLGDKELNYITYDKNTNRNKLWVIPFKMSEAYVGETLAIKNDEGALALEKETKEKLTFAWNYDRTEIIIFVGGSTGWWGGFLDRIIAAVMSPINQLRDWLIGLPAAIYDYFTNQVANFITGLGNKIAGIITGFGETVKGWIEDTAENTGIAMPVVAAAVFIVAGVAIWYGVKLILYMIP